MPMQSHLLNKIVPFNKFSPFDFLFAFFKTFLQIAPGLWQTGNRTRIIYHYFVCISNSTHGFTGHHNAAVFFVYSWVWFALFHLRSYSGAKVQLIIENSKGFYHFLVYQFKDLFGTGASP